MSFSHPPNRRRTNSDAASFYSTITDPLSSPTDGYFRSQQPTRYGSSGSVPTDVMYIDTDAANAAAKKPRVEVTRSSPVYREQTTPLMETFVGQDAPPSYLEATTPMGWRGEAVGLLDEERPALTPLREEGHQDGQYRRRSLRDFFSRKRIKWAAAILAIIALIAIIVALAHRDSKVRRSRNEHIDSVTDQFPARCCDSHTRPASAVFYTDIQALERQRGLPDTVASSLWKEELQYQERRDVVCQPFTAEYHRGSAPARRSL